MDGVRKLTLLLCGVGAVVVAVGCGPVTAGDGAVGSAKAETAAPGPKAVVWTNLIGATANGNSLQKMSGCDGCPDAGAVSEQQIRTGSGYMELTASETNTLRAIGFATGSSGPAPQDIKFSFWFHPGGIAEIRESGQYRTETRFAPGDILRIAVQQAGVSPGLVRYYKNGNLIHRSTEAPEFPLLVTASLLSLYSSLNNVVMSSTP